MSLLVAVAALSLLMFAAYRGFSVIIVAPLAAMLAVLLTDPGAVAPMFTGVFMEKMAGFLKVYFPVFALGAIFGKFIELSGFSRALVAGVISIIGRDRSIAAIVGVAALLTYGGVSLFVVVFAVYPFAAEMFREADVPKRLIPATIALGAFTFTMTALPGSPQIQNIIPTTFFKTDTWAAPWLGLLGGLYILIVGLWYLNRRRRAAQASGEGYGSAHSNEPEHSGEAEPTSAWIALIPLLVVAVANKVLTLAIPQLYPASTTTQLSPSSKAFVTDVASVTAIWAVEGALMLGIVCVAVLAWRKVVDGFSNAATAAVGGAMLAAMNTASEYGFGAVIASLPGFAVIAQSLNEIPDPLVREAVSVTTLAGITGSASGGMSIALAAMSDSFLEAAAAAQISPEVLHRVAAMASGGMDTLPHNGAVITLLAVTGLTHRQSYRDIFMIACVIATSAVVLVIAGYNLTGLI